MENLPSEVLFKIFKFFNFEERLVLSDVCQRFLDIASNYHFLERVSLTVRSVQDIKKFQRFLERSSVNDLYALEVFIFDANVQLLSQLNIVFEGLPSLMCLCILIKNVEKGFPEIVIPQSVKHFLFLGDIDKKRTKKTFEIKGLMCLQLTPGNGYINPSLDVLAASRNTLKSFYCQAFSYDNPTLKMLGECSELEALCVCPGNDLLYSLSIKILSLLPNWKNLKILMLVNCDVTKCINALNNCLKSKILIKLESLIVCYSEDAPKGFAQHLDNDFLECLIIGCPNLVLLYLHRLCPEFHDLVKFLQNCFSLKFLARSLVGLFDKFDQTVSLQNLLMKKDISLVNISMLDTKPGPRHCSWFDIDHSWGTRFYLNNRYRTCNFLRVNCLTISH
jgi:hypothetical protein